MSERERERGEMVRQQIAARGIDDEAVLRAMQRVPRHRFMHPDTRGVAYGDHPAPIGYQQTISQPYIVAYMTDALDLTAEHKVLEIGTGSGYQAAVLAEVAGEVFTIEIVEPLARRARETLESLGYENIRYRVGDGYAGWAEAAPFDAIMLTAAPPEIPQPLLEQLAIGGVMIAPVGRERQELIKVTRSDAGFSRTRVMGVRFVPMTGRAQAQ